MTPRDQEPGKRISARAIRDLAFESDKLRPMPDATVRLTGSGGTGQVNPFDGWDAGNVTSVSGSGNGARYGYAFLAANGTGNVVPVAGFFGGSTTELPGINLAYPATGSDLSIGDMVLIRPASQCGGAFRELMPVGGIASDPQSKNYIINGGFVFGQRGGAGGGEAGSSCITQTGNFTFDRWFLVSEANVTWAQRNKSLNYNINSKYFGCLSQSSGGANGVLLCQVVNKIDSKDLSGQTVTVSLSAEAVNSNVTINFALYSVSGQNDAATIKTNLVGGWSNHTPGIGGGYSTIANGSFVANSSAWTQGTATGTAPTWISGSINLVMAIWANMPTGAGNAIRISEAGLYTGSYTGWVEPVMGEEWLRCAEYYYQPNWNGQTFTGGSFGLLSFWDKNSGYIASQLKLPTPLRNYNPSATSPYANISNTTTNATTLQWKQLSDGNMAGNYGSLTLNRYAFGDGYTDYMLVAQVPPTIMSCISNGAAGYWVGIANLAFDAEI